MALAIKPILLSWSGGKDSCMALAETSENRGQLVVGLLSTVTEGFERVSMHGVRVALLKQQAAALGLPLRLVYIPQDATNEVYESRMAEALAYFQRQGISEIAFGDLFLADIREYRERRLSRIGIRATAIDRDILACHRGGWRQQADLWEQRQRTEIARERLLPA
jgi:diphthamide synthase (EF-2-diphthine--ammonia ligase)